MPAPGRAQMRVSRTTTASPAARGRPARSRRVAQAADAGTGRPIPAAADAFPSLSPPSRRMITRAADPAPRGSLFDPPAFPALPNLRLPDFLSGLQSAAAPRGGTIVFVAGATGRLGARAVHQLLSSSETLRVRAAARDPEAGAAMLAAAVRAGLLGEADAKRVTVVRCDVEDPASLPAAIGPATVVVQCIGASETSADLGAPARIDGAGACALVAAAADKGVDQYIMVTSLGTGKVGFPAAVLNLFGGILTQKRRAEAALEASGIPYLILRPGGLERPTDDHDASHAVVGAPRDTLFGGSLSRLQVASVIAAAVANPSAATNKCVELISERSAPRVPLADLLAAAATEEDQEERLARLGVAAARAASAAGARKAAAQAAQVLAAAKAAAADAAKAAKEAAAAAAAARAAAAPALREAAAARSRVKAAAEAEAEARAVEGAAKAVLTAAQAAARRGVALTDQAAEDAALPFLDPGEYERRLEAAAVVAAEAREALARAARERAVVAAKERLAAKGGVASVVQAAAPAAPAAVAAPSELAAAPAAPAATTTTLAVADAPPAVAVVPPNVASARAWVNAWRVRTLEGAVRE